jgi:hypothetical protein
MRRLRPHNPLVGRCPGRDTGAMRRPAFAAFLLLLAAPWLPGQAAVAPAAAAVHGRVEQHQGLRVLRTWGTPQERGYAHGFLLGADVAAVMRAEFGARFGRKPQLLELARRSLPRLIDWPEDVRAEIEALFAGVRASGADRKVPELDREWDLDDLLVGNALDVFGLMGCSGFTAWGGQVDGGGVLTGRNFDWPYTGAHMLDQTLLLVQHLPGGAAVASVAWPGYVGVVTGVNRDGIAAFLHVGSGRVTFTPEPGSWPTAVAAREILAHGRAELGAKVFELALDRLGWTSAPAGYLTRIVLPAAPPGDSPLGLFEADARKVLRADVDGPAVVTNHFLGRKDGREASKDSLDRHRRVCAGLDDCLTNGDRRVSVGEAWTMLESVQRGGGHAFGTLHSLVFRREPWCFELRIAEHREEGLVAAPVSPRRHALGRAAVFPDDPAAGGRR